MLEELSVRRGNKLWYGDMTILNRYCSETLLNMKPQLLATDLWNCGKCICLMWP